MHSEELKRRVRDANNIVDVVQAAVGKLTRAGRNLKACCPFHNEKTPSFNVNMEGQYFKCFGCGKSGDVFTFVMLHERVEFFEAFKILADRAGIRIEFDPKAAEQAKKETDWKSYSFKLNDAACKFYREQLFSNAGLAAREYIKKRGLSDEICERFRIGYAPPAGSSTNLLGRLHGLGAPPKAILAAGLATQWDNGGIGDFFRDRLMFPIADIQGRVIAFGGRILGDGEPKYLNTRETKLFSKTHTVYGLDHAREQIVATRTAILVEGYTDVMMCHQFGVTHVVACLGTAITAEHVRQLRRVADQLLLLTDSDAAGAKASERSLSVLFEEKMPAKVARLPGADKDPCDFLLAHGKDLFLEALTKALELFDYKFDIVSKKHDLRTPQGLKNAAVELMTLISLIPDTLLKNRYRYEILKRLNIDERDLSYEVKTARQPVPDKDTKETPESSTEYRDSGAVPLPDSGLAKTERELLKFLFHEPAFLAQAVETIDLQALSGLPEREIGIAILEAMSEGKLPPDPGTFNESGPESIVAREVLSRLQDQMEKGIVKVSGAKSLCIALAEDQPTGSKLDPDARFSILCTTMQVEALQMKIGEATRRMTHARVHGDVQGEQQAEEELVRLRREAAKHKSSQLKNLRGR